MVIVKVVFHIDEPSKWNHAISNVTNFLEQVPDAKIVLLANGDAIAGYTNSELTNRMAQLSNVEFHACNNSMNSHGLTKQDIPAFIIIVPAGVVDLAKLQYQGFAYIKP